MMTGRTILLSLFVGAAIHTVCLAEEGRDDLSPGKELFEQGKFEQAITRLETAVRASPEDAEIYYYLGLCYLETRRYWLAPAFFQRALELDPSLAPEAHLNAGYAYMRMGNSRLAEERFSMAAGAAPDSKISAMAEEYLAELKEERFKVKPWRLRVDSGYEYDSNVVLMPEDEDIVEVTGREDFRFFVNADTEVEFPLTRRWSVISNYNFYQSVHNYIGEYNLQSHIAGGRLSGILGEFRLDTGYYYDYSFLDDNKLNFLRRHTLPVVMDYWGARSMMSRLSYRYSINDYLYFTGPDVTDRSGHTNEVGVDQYFFFNRYRSYFRLGFHYDRESAFGVNFLHNGYRSDATLLADLPWNWEAELGAEYYYKDYPRNLDHRSDHYQNYLAAIRKRLNNYLAVTLQYELFLNDSVVPLYTFHRNILTLKATLDF